MWHFLGLLTAIIWGSTFAASSILISAGLTPAEIMCLRFLIAYALMLPFEFKAMAHDLSSFMNGSPASRRVRIKDELMFIALGVTGGSLYFLSENYAIKLTNFTSTVALIVCTCPILTAVLHRIIWRKEHLSNRFLFGSLIAMSGVCLVVLNGVFVLDDNPWVILLSFSAALLWAFYSIILKVLDRRYASDIITRKVFLWGIISMLPFCLWEAERGGSQLIQSGIIHWDFLFSPTISITLLFLSLIASLGCFLTWNIVCKRLTIVTASNYLYLNPVTSLWVGTLILGEQATWTAIIGCAVTLAGVYLCNRTHS